MTLVLGLLAVAVASAAAVTAMLVVRDRVPRSGLHVEAGPSQSVFGVLGTAFAVILAFVILLALQSYDTARKTAGQEAVAVTQLYRTTALLGEPVGGTLRGQLVCYGRAVAEDEWPVQGQGRQSLLVQRWLEELGATIATVEPEGVAQSTAYAQWFERDTDRREGRRGRLSEATPLVPAFLWLVLGLAALLVIGYVLLFADPRERRLVQGAMAGSITAVIGFGLLVVLVLDRPYGVIDPTEMRRTLALAETTDLPGDERVDPPCDDSGATLDGG